MTKKKKNLISTWTIDSISPSWVDKMKTFLRGKNIFPICATKYFGFATSFFSLYFFAIDRIALCVFSKSLKVWVKLGS